MNTMRRLGLRSILLVLAGVALSLILLSLIGNGAMTEQITVKRAGFPDGYSAAGVSDALTAAGYTLDAMYGENKTWVFKVSEATETDRAVVEALIDGKVTLDGGVLPSQSQYGDFATLRVTNQSGSAAEIGDIGYLDGSLTYRTTTTAGLLSQLCVVVARGDASADIVVATRGRVTVRYTGTDPATGDYLVTSTTAGRAARQTFVNPAIFAKALGNGADGEVSVLLLTQRRTVLRYAGTSLVYSVAGSSGSGQLWTGTINDASPSTSPVTITTTGGKDINTITPGSVNDLAGVVIRNTTRGSEAVLYGVSGGALVFLNSEIADWQNGDSLTAVSNTLGNNVRAVEVKNETVIPPHAVSLVLNMAYQDTSGFIGAHLWLLSEGGAYNAANTQILAMPVANVEFQRLAVIDLYDRRFGVRNGSSGTGSGYLSLFLWGWVEAIP